VAVTVYISVFTVQYGYLNTFHPPASEIPPAAPIAVVVLFSRRWHRMIQSPPTTTHDLKLLDGIPTSLATELPLALSPSIVSPALLLPASFAGAAYLRLVADVQNDGRDRDRVDERNLSGARSPSEVSEAVGVEVYVSSSLSHGLPDGRGRLAYCCT
jgi:hypothetical protein